MLTGCKEIQDLLKIGFRLEVEMHLSSRILRRLQPEEDIYQLLF